MLKLPFLRDPFARKDAMISPYRLEDSADRYRWWLRRLREARLLKHEVLVETVEVDVPRTLPPPMEPGRVVDAKTRRRLKADVASMRPWGYAIQLAEGIATGRPKDVEKLVFRTHLVMNGIRAVLGEDVLAGARVLDLASNHGFFSLACRKAGARHVTGVDLRPSNVAKAEYLKAHFGADCVDFEVRNVYDVDGNFDVVLNLGLLYHVTDPYRLIRRTAELAGRIAVVDTITHKSPVSAFVLRPGKNLQKPGNGEFDVELHPTYRALVDLMMASGFSRVVEVVPREAPDRARHPLYDEGLRRCLIGVK